MRTTEYKRMREGKQHEHTKRIEEVQTVTGQRQIDNQDHMRGACQEENDKRNTRR